MLFTVPELRKHDSQPVRLFARDGPKIQPEGTYIGSDGKLHTVTMRGGGYDDGDENFSCLRWWIFDPSSGRVLREVRKHKWLWRIRQSIPFDPSGRHVMAMVDLHTIAVMVAESLDEITRCDLSQSLSAPSLQATRLRWSQSGRMLAVLMQPKVFLFDPTHELSQGGPHTQEVHVFSATTGNCLRSLSMHAAQMIISWSSSQDLLLVWTLDAGAPGVSKIQVLSPSCNESADVALESAASASGPGNTPFQIGPAQIPSPAFAELEWIPDGTLLRAQTRDKNTREVGLYILDPTTFDCVFQAQGRSLDAMCWVETPRQGAGVCTSVAYFYIRHEMVEIGHLSPLLLGQAASWHVQYINLSTVPSQTGLSASLSPSGSHLVALDRDDKMEDCFHVHHHKLAAAKGVASCNGPRYQRSLDKQRPISWAPLPGRWANIYVAVETTSPEAQEANATSSGGHHVPHVTLVDVTSDNILGSWALGDLAQQASHAEADHALPLAATPHVQWAADGCHLAVHAELGRAFLLTFA